MKTEDYTQTITHDDDAVTVTEWQPITFVGPEPLDITGFVCQIVWWIGTVALVILAALAVVSIGMGVS